VGEVAHPEGYALDAFHQVVDGLGRAVADVGAVPGNDLVTPASDRAAEAAHLGGSKRSSPTSPTARCRPGDPHHEVWFALNAKEVVRQIYDHTDHQLAVEVFQVSASPTARTGSPVKMSGIDGAYERGGAP
jgi:hypothetical protein